MTKTLYLIFVFLTTSVMSFSRSAFRKTSPTGDIEALLSSGLNSDISIESLPQGDLAELGKPLFARARIHSDCDVEREAILLELQRHLQLVTHTALATLQRPDPYPFQITKYVYYFGAPSTTRTQVTMRYQRVMNAIIYPRVSIRCVDEPGGRCHQMPLVAYTTSTSPFITLCPLFWALPLYSLAFDEDKVSTILHHLTRLNAVMQPATTDEPFPVREGGTTNPWRNVPDRSVLINNAYSYEWFAKELMFLAILQRAGHTPSMPRGSWITENPTLQD